jgi:hypothetical protein
MSRESDPKTPFTLWCNNVLYLIASDSNTEASERGAALIKRGTFTAFISNRVVPETASAFIAACSLQDPQLTAENAWELLDLANEWKIPTLITKVKAYIQAEALHKPTVPDYLGDFIRRSESGEDVSLDIENLANNVNLYFKDERLAELRPELLFKVCVLAKSRYLNEDLFTEFVLKLFEGSPEKVVPLCLLLNFDRLTDSQRNLIFQCREIHELALGYFLGAAVSSDRNRAIQRLGALNGDFDRLSDQVRHAGRHAGADAVKTAQTAFQSEIAALKKRAADQQAQIESLQALKDSQQKKIDDESALFDQQLAELQQELDRQVELAKRKQEDIARKRALIQAEVDKQVETMRAAIDAERADVEATAGDGVAQLDGEIKGGTQDRRDELRAAKREAQPVADGDQAVQKGIAEWRATFAAKCVRDEFRADYYIRDIEKRFELFDGAIDVVAKWNLTGEVVKNAGDVIRELEKQIDETCPKRRLVSATTKSLLNYSLEIIKTDPNI